MVMCAWPPERQMTEKYDGIQLMRGTASQHSPACAVSLPAKHMRTGGLIRDRRSSEVFSVSMRRAKSVNEQQLSAGQPQSKISLGC